MATASVRPVVLCGGGGARLWPLSTPDRPKPYLALTGHRTLLQETLLRVSDASLYAPALVIAAHRHRFLAAEQMRQVGAQGALVLEPCARGTALAVAVAALIAADEDPAALLLILPADHHIPDARRFARDVRTGAAAAKDGAMVLFGVRPTEAATGFGYICPGGGAGMVRPVRSFTEKPDAARAGALMAAGALWNAGIFLARVDVLIGEFADHAPAVLAAARAALAGACRDADDLRLAAEPIEPLVELSFDHAIVERTSRAAVVEAGFAWSDIGAWSSVQVFAAADPDGNAAEGPVRLIGARNAYVRSDGPRVAVVGLSDVIVVATAEGILVTRKGADQAVRLAAQDSA